jgi:hypothetical protein
VIHKLVVPTAAPVVSYRASDDFGISRLSLAVEIERGNQQQALTSPLADQNAPSAGVSTKVPPPEIEMHRFDILPAATFFRLDQLPLTGSYRLPLAPLKLALGDRLKLTLEAIDYRGEDPAGRSLGQGATSEPITLQVADETAVIAAIAEADKRSEQQLSEIIERQLSSGADR